VILQSAEVDDNRDGIIERIHVNIQLPLKPKESIQNIQCLFFHDVQLNSRAKYEYDSLTHITYSSTLSFINNIYIDGNIKIRQNSPLIVSGGYVKFLFILPL
jgi:hypothetical protein